jgi:hypothetical protein
MTKKQSHPTSIVANQASRLAIVVTEIENAAKTLPPHGISPGLGWAAQLAIMDWIGFSDSIFPE